MVKKAKIPWPTKAVMEQIYEMKLWGGTDVDFYSGTGSHKPEIIEPYLKAVTNFLNSFETPLAVLDLGCGDFNVGKHFIKYSKNYIGIDIVEALIERNKTLFKAENLEFHCLDISKDELPKADCVILRQVLQHLSNNEILRILEKLAEYKFIILTEHIPTGDFEPNKDIIASQGNHVKHGSGVDILKAPFHFKVASSTVLNEYVLADKSRIVTTLIEPF
ncbi:MAG: class I SAM-dependent methyltransferase [Jejuia sp.]